MKEKIITALLPFQYPQVVFGKEIRKIVDRNIVSSRSILDVPCGNGEVSYHLSKCSNASVTGVDISEVAIANAKRRITKKNITFMVGDIKQIIAGPPTYDVVCIVNSLYLLGDHSFLFKSANGILKNEHSKFFLVVPNIEHPSYKVFKASEPSTNFNEIGDIEILELAAKTGFKNVEVKDIVFAGAYSNRAARYLSVLGPFYLRFLNFCAQMIPGKKGQLSLVLF